MNKYVFLVLAISVLIGCGISERIGKNCGGDLKEVCHDIFGGRTAELQEDMRSEIDEIRQRIESLESQKTSILSQISIIETLIQNQQVTLSEVYDYTIELQTELDQVNLSLAHINGYKNIVELVDPCGKEGVWDEVLFKLTDGSYLASFSDNTNGKNTRFVVLSDGNYQTTDGTNCHFSIQSGVLVD